MQTTKTSKLPFIFLGVMVAVLAVATVLDKGGTSSSTPPVIYGKWWFVLLWTILSLTAVWYTLRRKLWMRPAVFALHLSFLVILTGATITHFIGRKGFIHLRQGEVAQQYMYYDEDGLNIRLHDMPFLMTLDTFYICYDADGVTPSDYVSHITLVEHSEKRSATVSMNHIGRIHGYRIFQTSYDEDAHGSLFTVSHDPWGTGVTYAGYALLAVSMVWLGIKKARRENGSNEKSEESDNAEKSKGKKTVFTPHFSLFTLLGILLASYMVISIAFRPLLPVLRSPMLFVHVGVIMVSYVLLVVSMLRRSMLRYAVFFLSAGIFLGAVWANISWGSYWSWDPKETWAIITLLVYSVPLHQQSLPWFRSLRNYRLYSLFCLLCLLMTYFGVNYLLGGMHSYAN